MPSTHLPFIGLILAAMPLTHMHRRIACAAVEDGSMLSEFSGVINRIHMVKDKIYPYYFLTRSVHSSVMLSVFHVIVDMVGFKRVFNVLSICLWTICCIWIYIAIAVSSGKESLRNYILLQTVFYVVMRALKVNYPHFRFIVGDFLWCANIDYTISIIKVENTLI